MKKIFLSAYLAISLLCSAAVPSAFADEAQISGFGEWKDPIHTVSTFPWKERVTSLYGDDGWTGFTFLSSNGNTVKLQYENISSYDAKVILLKYDNHMPTVVTSFDAASNSTQTENYTLSNSDDTVYNVRVLSKSGREVDGYLTIELIDFPFTDIPADAWYWSPVEYVYQNGLFSGTSETTFSPEQDMTRAQIITILGGMSGETMESEPSAFPDVPDNAYYAKYINWAQKNGIVAGFTDGKFHPDDVITREQIAVIINKYIDDIGFNYSHEYVPFADESQISGWAKDAVVNIVKYGIMTGDGNNQFSPKNSIVRAEGAIIITNLHQKLI